MLRVNWPAIRKLLKMIEYGGMIFQGYIILVILQTALWLIQNFTKDASSADVGWSVGMSLLVFWYAIHLPGFSQRKWMLLTPLLMWTIRLSSHSFMLFLLMKVTGIPIMEQRAIERKGQAFLEYKRTTSFFIPMFSKRI